MATTSRAETLENKPSRAENLENKPSLPAKELAFDFLEKITDNFSDKRLLGTGSFGSVYQGILEDGGAVAVKKLRVDAPVPAEKIFANEIENIMVLEHENVVKLVAFCRESAMKPVLINGVCRIAPITETVLCYEYFPKRSLDKHIFGGSNIIDWNTRFQIIKGISKGIHYLHSLTKPVWHLGLKPQNILLDDNMVPKIADFVYSRIFGGEKTRRTQSELGTVGYMAPEHLVNGEISARSDIYSLGLIIMEIVTREKNSSSIDQKHAREYIEDVKKNWTQEKIMDEYDELDDGGLSQVEACIEIGKQCVELNQYDRPTIQEIIKKLSGH